MTKNKKRKFSHPKRKLGIGSMMTTFGGLGVILNQLIGSNSIVGKINIILYCLTGILLGLGLILVISGMVEQK